MRFPESKGLAVVEVRTGLTGSGVPGGTKNEAIRA